MTPNQVVAYNVTKARALRGWTQEQAAEALAPYLGAKLSSPSFSALERSVLNVDRIRQFSADDLLALSRGFGLPIGYFFTPPPRQVDAGVYGDGGETKGIDPSVLLDAILGTPINLGYWMDDLVAYSSRASIPSVASAELSARLRRLVDLRARTLVRNVLGDLDGARDVLERLGEMLRLPDDAPPSRTADQAAPSGIRVRAPGAHSSGVSRRTVSR